MMPGYIKKRLAEKAEMENCSISWLICEAIMNYLNISTTELEKERGKEIPKTFSERRKKPGWAYFPNKCSLCQKVQRYHEVQKYDRVSIGKIVKSGLCVDCIKKHRKLKLKLKEE